MTGVCIVHGLEDGPGASTDDPWEGVDDGPALDGPAEDSDVPGDRPVRGVMGEGSGLLVGSRNPAPRQTGCPHHRAHLQTHHLRRCTLTEWGRGCIDAHHL